MTNYAKKHPYLLGAIIVSIAAIVGLALGYRIQPNMRIAKNGTLEITLPLRGTVVYSDDKKLITTVEENETVRISLPVKTHDIIIGREGYFPWMAQATIQPAQTLILTPFFVTQNTTGQIITRTDAQYWNIRSQVINTKIPTEATPKTLRDVSIWITDNTIYLKKDNQVQEIITPEDTVRSLDFYKDRTDIIVFATDTGVYAMDAVEDALNNVVNFYPIYKGVNPLFQKTDNSFLYVLDGENLMMVVL